MQSNARIFQVLDLDRTLFNTKHLEEVAYELVGLLHPDIAQKAYEESDRYSLAGSSFFMFEFLRSALTPDEYSAFVEELKETTSPHDFLLEGAMERIAFASSQEEWTAGIMTYGNEQDQFLKLELCGLDTFPWMIVPKPDKGAIIASWQQQDGSFVLPDAYGGITVDLITLDDDKPEAFLSMPSNTIGVLVVGSSVLATQGIPDYSQEVCLVSNLTESIHFLRTRLM